VPVTVVGKYPGFGPPHVSADVAVPPATRVTLVADKPQARPLIVDRPTVPAKPLKLATEMVDVAVEVPALETRVDGVANTLNKGVLTV
jgi:hypothetical protein